ncbi:CBN-UGT-53 protein, partial [Aphelenchoides avenae]
GLHEVFTGAKDGVVLFSFGSITDTTKMSKEMKLAFLEAFARFPNTNFIWKLQTTGNDSQLLERYPNVHVVDGLDQVSIL